MTGDHHVSRLLKSEVKYILLALAAVVYAPGIMPLTANIFPCMHWRSMKPVFGAASDQTCHRAGQAVSLAKISNIVQSAP